MKRFLQVIGFLLLIAHSLNSAEMVRSIHVIVALCDNQNQGIVPVPKSLGNGQDPASNLYWGAMYGTKTFFKNSKDWTLLRTVKNLDESILERCVFQHTDKTILVADAYDGAKIATATSHLFQACSGTLKKKVIVDKKLIGLYGNANLMVYIGHNGLMDFSLPNLKLNANKNPMDVMALACKSQPYFEPLLNKFNANSLLLTTNFMAPEAYTLKATIDGWLIGESGKQIRERAAKAYHHYQKCGIKGARRLFYTADK